MPDEKVVEMSAESIRNHTAIFDKQRKEIEKLKMEKEWVITDFAKMLQFYSKAKTTLDFHKGIIREQVKKALGK